MAIKDNITNKLPKTYVVLGMHRSGTSFITKSLLDQGVDMGKLSTEDELTLYEDKEFGELNNRIIEKAGGTWDEPPKEEDIVLAGQFFKEDIKALLAKRKSSFWGWKDPRTVITFPAYAPYLEGDMYLVCMFRKPRYVVRSLRSRNKELSAADYLELTQEYNQRIISIVKKFVGI